MQEKTNLDKLQNHLNPILKKAYKIGFLPPVIRSIIDESNGEASFIKIREKLITNKSLSPNEVIQAQAHIIKLCAKDRPDLAGSFISDAAITSTFQKHLPREERSKINPDRINYPSRVCLTELHGGMEITQRCDTIGEGQHENVHLSGKKYIPNLEAKGFAFIWAFDKAEQQPSGYFINLEDKSVKITASPSSSGVITHTILHLQKSPAIRLNVDNHRDMIHTLINYLRFYTILRDQEMIHYMIDRTTQFAYSRISFGRPLLSYGMPAGALSMMLIYQYIIDTTIQKHLTPLIGADFNQSADQVALIGLLLKRFTPKCHQKSLSILPLSHSVQILSPELENAGHVAAGHGSATLEAMPHVDGSSAAYTLIAAKFAVKNRAPNAVNFTAPLTPLQPFEQFSADSDVELTCKIFNQDSKVLQELINRAPGDPMNNQEQWGPLMMMKSLLLAMGAIACSIQDDPGRDMTLPLAAVRRLHQGFSNHHNIVTQFDRPSRDTILAEHLVRFAKDRESLSALPSRE